MPNPPTNSGIRDNHHRGAVADFLKLKIHSNSRLSVVSACFTIYAYDALREHLDQIEHLDFLFGEPRFISSLDPEKTEKKSFILDGNGLHLANRLRLNRRLDIHPETGWRSYDSVEPDLEPIDYVARLAKEDDVENVVKWALDEDYKRGGESSRSGMRELISLIKTGCAGEIAILRTIYGMENNKVECPDIVTKARELLQEHDRRSTMTDNKSKPVEDISK